MNVKGVQPFDLLSDVTARLEVRQMPIRHFSAHRREQHPQAQPIPQQAAQQEGDRTGNLDAKGDRVCDTGNDQKHGLQCDKGGIIAGPVILGLLAIVSRLVDHLRTRAQQRLHLIEGTLNVHLSYVGETLQILHRAIR